MYIDKELVTDAYFVLSNEGDFHLKYWNPLDLASYKYYKKDGYKRGKYLEAMQERIREFLKNGDRNCSYHGVKIARHNRLAIAAKFADVLEDDMKKGNM